MKGLLQRLTAVRGSQWLWLVLAAALLVWTLLPQGSGQSDPGMTDQEQRVAAVLSAIEGVGQVRVVVYADEVSDSFGKTSAQPRGAVVVAQGADDLAVRLRLTAAARALLQLPANAIEIFPMEAP